MDTKTGQLSANSLAYDPRVLDHFPRLIYCEDWLFAYASIKTGNAGLTPRHYYIQDEYDPFDQQRAREEQFGDILSQCPDGGH